MATRKKRAKPNPAQASAGGAAIDAYSQAQKADFRDVRSVAQADRRKYLEGNVESLARGSPAWFLGENPVVGYSASKKSVKLLFWNSKALDEPDLKAVGKYRATRAIFAYGDEIDPQVVRRWLEKAKSSVFDSMEFFENLRPSARKKKD